MSAASTTASARGLRLSQLVADRASAADIAGLLDRLPSEERVSEVLSVTGRGVKYLYDAAAGAQPLALEEMVPASERGTVIFEGRNSLPLFSRFQKRFARVGEHIIGYNHQTMSFVTGPGYFVVKAPAGSGDHGDELLFDYTLAPPKPPAGWPDYQPNDRGLSKAVYGNMKDWVRRVATGVVVGKAYKLGVDQKAYFSLTLPR